MEAEVIAVFFPSFTSSKNTTELWTNKKAIFLVKQVASFTSNKLSFEQTMEQTDGVNKAHV